MREIIFAILTFVLFLFYWWFRLTFDFRPSKNWFVRNFTARPAGEHIKDKNNDG